MSINEKFGCLLYATDLQSIYEDEQERKRSDRGRKKHARKIIRKMIKPIDFFLYNEILVANSMNENDSVYGARVGDTFEDMFYSFSSFIPIKSKKEIVLKEEITRSEYDDPESSITYGAFNYPAKCGHLVQKLSVVRTRIAFCSTLTNTFKKTLDILLYLKKNDAIHLGMAPETILVQICSGDVQLDGVKHIRFLKDLFQSSSYEHIIKTTLCDKENVFVPIFAPIEVSLLLFLFDNELPTVSAGNVRSVIKEHLGSSPILSGLPSAFQSDYVTNCETSLGKYINVSKKDIVADVLKNGHSWNVYALSVTFLAIMMTTQRFCVNLLKTGIFNKWFKLLLMNTHPDPKRRKTVEENISIFAKLSCVNAFSEFGPFLKEITDDNLLKLTEQFVKRA